ncbi:MAG: dihydroorotase [Halobacteriota archaeon]|nr:dihydroorotase [Halobacteriota archaeon]
MDCVIKNSKLFMCGEIQNLNLSIKDGVINKIGKDLKADNVIDAGGLLILSGAIDAHVHFRDMGEMHKEDWYTGSCAAVAGGVTTVIEHPNTKPPTTSVIALKKKLKTAERSIVDFGINAGVTDDPSELRELWNHGVTAFGEIFMTDLDEGQLLKAFKMIKRLDATSCVHAEDKDLVSEKPTRPPICEIKAIESVLYMKKITDVKLHVCHLSTKRGLELLKESSASVEVTPHHLFLSEEDFKEHGSFVKMNPPLRGESNRRSLWHGLKDGSIDIIASDHAPHTKDEKSVDLPRAPSGVPGVETMVPLMLSAVKKGTISMDRFVSLTSFNPAKIFGLDRKGEIAVGKDADLIFVDMKNEREIEGGELHGKTRWTPFEGMKGIFPEKVILRGEVVFDDGEIVGEAGHGRFLTGGGG